ncbi:single-stranded DNA-binding protein [Caudoviricetes sp.]|nr:single-stranded DNA-binding protein [Caudoviricetes sp.]
MATTPITTPVGELEWVFISGKGKEDLQGNPTYTCDLVLEGDAAEQLKAAITKIWQDGKPSHIATPKSTGYRAHAVKTDQKDETGKPIYKETGKTAFTFKTGTSYSDGSAKVIKIFNAKGAEIALGQQSIGNGSKGRIAGSVGIYTVEAKGKVMQAGTTLYLNSIQLAKFVPYTGGASFDAIEGDCDGVGEVGGIPDETPSTPVNAPAKPRL